MGRQLVNSSFDLPLCIRVTFANFSFPGKIPFSNEELAIEETGNEIVCLASFMMSFAGMPYESLALGSSKLAIKSLISCGVTG